MVDDNQALSWRPIEAAPRDGEPVILWKTNEPRVGEYMLIGYWGGYPGHTTESWIAVDGKPQGYFSTIAGKNQGYPTHWMPLPPQPTPEAQS